MTDNAIKFEWLPEHDIVLQKIASTDEVETDWDKLRAIVKHKIQQNISLFLSTTKPPPPPTAYPETVTENGGLKLPPFPPRKLGQLHVSDPPVCYMDEKQVKEMKDAIYEQLDGFEGNPPFTIQRLCELCIAPKTTYTSIGKYLRALLKTILVTSTQDAFPPFTEQEIAMTSGRSAITLGSTIQSAPSTPLFSPIPFLHEDARRSRSRSRSREPEEGGGGRGEREMTPLSLNPVVSIDEEPMEVKALGMVDELDDPGPGHLSDHPTALTSVTTVPDASAPTSSSTTATSAASTAKTKSPQTIGSKPTFFGTLEQRFVKSKSEDADDAMDIDTSESPTESASISALAPPASGSGAASTSTDSKSKSKEPVDPRATKSKPPNPQDADADSMEWAADSEPSETEDPYYYKEDPRAKLRRIMLEMEGGGMASGFRKND